MKTKRKAAASSQKYRGKQSYGIGGAVMSGVNSIMNKQKLLPSLLNAGKALIDPTPMSTVTQGLKLGSTIAGKSKNPAIQNLSKLSGLASTATGFLGGGGGQNFLQNIGGGQGFQNFLQNIPGRSAANGMRVKSYDEGGEVEKEPPSVARLLEALGTDDKRSLNQLLNQQYRIDMKRLEQEGNEELDADRDEQRRLDKEYRIDMRTPEVDSEEGDLEEGYDYTEGSEAKERMMKLIKSGGLGLGAISVASLAPLIYKLLKKKKDSIDSNAQYHNILDPRPGPRDPFFRQPNQSARGRNQ